MIVLEKFNSETDIKRLIKWIDTNKLNLIWASDKFSFPLTENQFNTYLKTAKNNILIFKVIHVEKEYSRTIGHAEIDLLDNEVKISRLIISKENRGKGYGEKMMIALIKYIKDNLPYSSICLTVFTFNKPAISLYKKLGFETTEIDKGFMTFEDEVWDRQKMKLKK